MTNSKGLASKERTTLRRSVSCMAQYSKKHIGAGRLLLMLPVIAFWNQGLAVAQPEQAKPQAEAVEATGQPRILPLEQCVGQALQSNHRRPASRFEVAMAEAQHRQALAGYWPPVNAKGGYQLLDQPTSSSRRPRWRSPRSQSPCRAAPRWSQSRSE